MSAQPISTSASDSLKHAMGRVQVIHFVGIGGVGMGGIAEVMLNLGFKVSGSDLGENALTQRLAQLGATVYRGHAQAHVNEADVLAFINALNLFGIGYSYGGFESLVIHCDPQLKRSHKPDLGGPLIRFACGLEDAGDLQNDIEDAFKAII